MPAVGVPKGPAVTPTCPGRTQLQGGQICLGCSRVWGRGDYPAGHWAASKQVRIQVRRDRLCWDVQGFTAYYFKSISVGVPSVSRLLLDVCLSVMRDQAFLRGSYLLIRVAVIKGSVNGS